MRNLERRTPTTNHKKYDEKDLQIAQSRERDIDIDIDRQIDRQIDRYTHISLQ